MKQNELSYNIHLMTAFMSVLGARFSTPYRTNTNGLWNGNACAA